MLADAHRVSAVMRRPNRNPATRPDRYDSRRMSTPRRIAVLTGGGDVPGLNAVIKSVVYRATEAGHEVIGIRRGWEGLTHVQPELPDGGGTGYVLEIDPFGGTASLDSFEEGQRRPIASKVTLPVVPDAVGARRLVLQAAGPSIKLSVDGETGLDVTDGRFSRGLIAVGVVTWSDPVAVTFDHIQLTGPTR